MSFTPPLFTPITTPLIYTPHARSYLSVSTQPTHPSASTERVAPVSLSYFDFHLCRCHSLLLSSHPSPHPSYTPHMLDHTFRFLHSPPTLVHPLREWLLLVYRISTFTCVDVIHSSSLHTHHHTPHIH